MKPMDLALLILVGSALLVAAVLFFVFRRRGNSRALATTKSTTAFGIVLALGFFVFTEQLLGSRASIGLEGFVLPPILFLASAVSGVIFGMLVHLVENLKAPETADLGSSIIQEGPSGARSSSSPGDWRAFAKEASEER